jgi:hypothetical protein
MIKSIVKNLSIFFSILGILMTLYLSIFYFPAYLRKSQDVTIERMNHNLVEGILELLYRNGEIELNTITSLIKGQEIREKTTYPYAMDQLLVQTQEALIRNEFIPMPERQSLVDQLDTVISRYQAIHLSTPNENHKTAAKIPWLKADYWNSTNVAGVLSGLFGILISLLGIYSLYYKLKVEKKEEIRAIIDEERIRAEENIRASLLYDNIVMETIQELGIAHKVFIDKTGKADARIQTSGGREVFLKARYFRDARDIPVNFVSNLIRVAEVNHTSGVFLSNIETREAADQIEQYNKAHEKKIYMIVAETKDEMKAMLMNTLERTEGKV